MAAWRRRRSIAGRVPSLAMSNFPRRSSKRWSRASSASMARRGCSLIRPSYSWNPRAVACKGRAARYPRMYSSATASSSASGLSGGGVGDGLGGFGEGDGFAAGEEEEPGEDSAAAGDGEAFDFDLEGETEGFSEGLGDGFANGFTGP